jgi:hypothetical protein
MLEHRYRGIKLAGHYLLGGGVDEAELAGGEVALRGAHGWTEGATYDGTGFVEVAGSGVRVEHGARLPVAKAVFVGEERGGLVIFVEDAGGGVARVVRAEASK